ncbi:uncharacterized protein LOC126748949 isoform X2 [Anthonomus grandis grandis]|uniref:uncharacterized protein LOC126748949 isoform X2 n=1 Tax=Anthonomus grandis grandis TaxID=2921223 RepID=UPI0021665C4F|nr:uncharacterized protein LOC126748949 isoform X2 [Anthonomus grandis grandis]
MILFIWFLTAFIKITFGIQDNILNCAQKDLTFEKLIGLPIPDVHNQQILIQSDKSNHSYSITLDCINSCRNNATCRSFIIFYKDMVCYWFDTDLTKVNFNDRTEGDADSAWFVKVCLSHDSQCKKEWIFESIRGATLVGDDTKILPKNISKTDCEQKCVDEEEFDCKSIEFRTNTNHFAQDNSMGMCILSNNNRYLMPNAYRVSSDDDYYLENQCNLKGENNENNKYFCAYEEYQDMLFLHGDLTFQNTSKEDCNDLCEFNEAFTCRGFSIMKPLTCILHSEDTKLRGPRMLTPASGSSYYEKARCLNINITCNDTSLGISYQPESAEFRGKLYMQGYSENPKCQASRQEKLNLVSLNLPLEENDCGIIKAESSSNRSLLTGMLVIQYNPLIQTQSDRLIKVGCIFTNENNILLGTGISISPNYSSKGSILINTYPNVTVTPVVEMHVVDMETQQETSNTQIGQILQLIIEMKEKNNSYDFWASRLIAMTEKGEESIFLLDDRGCPTNPNIFPPLQKIMANGTRLLTGVFQAFKFASSPVVRLSVMVHFCSIKCPPIECVGAKTVFSVRRERELPAHDIKAVMEANSSVSNVTNINNSIEISSDLKDQIPLEYTMTVTDLNFNPSKFILDHHGTILVAGYRSATNEVCMDYNLVIGLIITWIIIQLLFIISAVMMLRRYKKHYKDQYTKSSMEDLHKNFGLGFSNLNKKRVRLADTDLM